MPQALARITPNHPPESAPPRRHAALSHREKAAIVVRFLLSEGATVPLAALPEHVQAALTEQMGAMRLVDRATVAAVVEEFMSELEQVGLSFPGGIDGAISLLDGHISPSAATRLRRLAGASGKADPWERLVTLPPERLLPALEDEAIEIAAVVLSKLPVSRAAALLERLPGERARRVAHAVALTGNVEPETVRRIGAALIAQIDATPPQAFHSPPEERIGAILNASPMATRDAVLNGLQADDADFAARVRKVIFTFVHIPVRIAPRDVARVVRQVEQPVLVTALAGAEGALEAAAEFLLANMSQRLAQALREEMAERGPVRPREAEEAQTAVVQAIRQLESTGEITLIYEESG